jgi:hypothetical protein
LRLTAARRGAILALLVILLALMLGSQQPIAQKVVTTPTPTVLTPLPEPPPREVYMKHELIFVKAQDLDRYEIFVDERHCPYGCEVVIIFYVNDLPREPSDIIFRALDPYGKEIYPRSMVERLRWSFTAERPGTYVLEFNNKYSMLDKIVDLVLAVRVPLTTITEYRTEYIKTLMHTTIEYRTLTETLTATLLPQESIEIFVLVAAVAFIAGILLTLLVRRS